MTTTSPGRVLRLAIAGWGLGDLAMGSRSTGFAWLAAELLLGAGVVAGTLLYADTTWYLLPFLLGMAFIGIWATQAIAAYHRAQRLQGAVPPAPSRSPAAAAAWLTVPLLLWGTGFWMIAGGASSPSAVVDRFVTRWSDLEPVEPPVTPLNGATPEQLVDRAAGLALTRLQELCDAGELSADCGATPKNLLRDVRVSVATTGDSATAVAQLVRYERFPSRVLGIFQGTDLRPVPIETILTLHLEAEPAHLGAERWTMVDAS